MIIQDILYQPICPICQTKNICKEDGATKYSNCPNNHFQSNTYYTYFNINDDILSINEDYSSRLFPHKYYKFQNGDNLFRKKYDYSNFFIDNYINPNITKQIFLKSDNITQLISKFIKIQSLIILA